MLEYYAMIVSFVAAVISSWSVTKWIIPKALERNMTGRDIHKIDRIFVSEMGGLGITFGFLVGIFVFIGLTTLWEISIGNIAWVYSAVVSVLILAIVGMVDDLFEIEWSQKTFFPVVGAIPLMVLAVGNPIINFPFFGDINFGLFYFLFLIPLGMTGAANAVNMLAGYNGVEASMGIVIMASLAIIAATSGSIASLGLLLAMIGALAGFLYFNWYPAKVFMGDSGTLQMGALIASAVIIGSMEKYGVLLFFWYFINFILFVWGIAIKAKYIKFAQPDEHGILIAPDCFWKHSLRYVLIKLTKPTEKELVGHFILLQVVVSIITLGLYFGGV